MRAIGLMSGTSLDGVDAAWIETDGETIRGTSHAATLHYEPKLRADLRKLLDMAARLAADEALPDDAFLDDAFLRDVERRLTEDHAIAVSLLGRGADVIGFHGQTILHAPARRQTWQIGDAAMLARLTRTKVVYDFRKADVAAGGQGAPLVPLFHAALAAALPKPLLIVNIGGVANITWLGAQGEILACDTGPGNGPLDDWVQRHTGQAYDENGALAAVGHVQTARLEMLLADPYFARPAPKSLDRLSFSALVEQAVAGLNAPDGAATLAAFTAMAIASAPLPAPPLRVLVCGGGRKNATIMRHLQAQFSVPVASVEAVGWDGDALEAQCFGFLAVRSLRGLPLSVPSTTGVPQPMPGGKLIG
ncbi:MAG: anhydro-N-acetylmuramic acid kinase [Acidocella sp. 20-57-95]|nr:MAG: anhydro-N-acetylmuramic acid kinase [Acidocella sp. 20-57-95]OYV58464.1 MAG: anhydro-N-acetylmuramic acid kinase [Acidocella sp. 21-58-7]HQT65182.1 anhydro-N-acetylmuramic acid kinase [Acidocella sp.]HQU04962.1 anhydro-N-acetylmuramic acid kinase [Acidocella sp.]